MHRAMGMLLLHSSNITIVGRLYSCCCYILLCGFPCRSHDLRRPVRSVGRPTPIDCRLGPWAPWTPCSPCTDVTVTGCSLGTYLCVLAPAASSGGRQLILDRLSMFILLYITELNGSQTWQKLKGNRWQNHPLYTVYQPGHIA